MQWIMRLTAMAIVATTLSGCALFHTRLNNSERLINRPDFPQAREAAPEWCRDALKTINELEYLLERQ